MSFDNLILNVDLQALRANYRLLRDRASPARCGAAVKADAYGLGMDHVIPALLKEDCDAFFVATFDEALTARALAPEAEIYVLEGLIDKNPSEFESHQLIPVISTLNGIKSMADTPIPCALHIDTGMNRLGVPVSEIEKLLEDEPDSLSQLPLNLVMSHLACADEKENDMNAFQLKAFNDIRHKLPTAPASLANSGGILLGAGYHHHLVRPGIALYGGAPGKDFEDILNPVVTLQARILQVKTIRTGESVGYGCEWTAERDSLIATLAIGYADGYHLSFSKRGKALIGGQSAPVVGRISMDYITVDVTELGSDKVQVGDYATLIGQDLSLDQVAKSGNMHAYQLLTSLGPRVKRVYEVNE